MRDFSKIVERRVKTEPQLIDVLYLMEQLENGIIGDEKFDEIVWGDTKRKWEK